jgi:glucose-specific phosphotransferase system IIA component
MLSLFSKKNIAEIKSPVIGKAIELEKVPDKVFASKMVGDGAAFESSDGIIYSPVHGKIAQIFPTKHAIGIITEDDLEILIHIGIDTIEMKGKGFKSLVCQNEIVNAGDKLMEFDIDLIKEKGKSTMIPVLITNMEMVECINSQYGDVDISSTVMKVKLKY